MPSVRFAEIVGTEEEALEVDEPARMHGPIDTEEPI